MTCINPRIKKRVHVKVTFSNRKCCLFIMMRKHLSYCIKKAKNFEEKKYGRKKHSFLYQTIVEKLITIDLLMKQCYKKGLHFLCTYG